MNHRSSTAALITALLVLTGCSAASTTAPEADVTADSSAAPSESPTANAGALISRDDALDLVRKSKGEWRGYPLPDGTFVVVNKHEPLPAAVQADVTAQGVDNATVYWDGSNTDQTYLRAREKMIAKVGVDTGKRVVALLHMTGYDNEGNFAPRYFFNGAFQPEVSYATAAEAHAALDAWLGTQAAPDDFVVIPPE